MLHLFFCVCCSLTYISKEKLNNHLRSKNRLGGAEILLPSTGIGEVFSLAEESLILPSLKPTQFICE